MISKENTTNKHRFRALGAIAHRWKSGTVRKSAVMETRRFRGPDWMPQVTKNRRL